MTEITKLSDVNLDDFIEFKDTDKQGKFSYVGKVVKIDKHTNYFEIQTMNTYRQGFYFNHGTLVGKLFKSDKPTGWDRFEKNPDDYIQKQQDKREAKRLEESKIKATVKEQVFALVKNNPKLDSNKLLKIAKRDIGGEEKLLTMFIRVAIMHSKRK